MFKYSLRHLLKIFIPLVLFCVYQKAQAQNFNPVEIRGLSTGSIYDLLADSRGFIWVAHETGISRYDGNSFTHFRNDQQTNLAMTDIIEDHYGRIWCHNFNGQLFYIEKEEMTLLKAYDNTKERSYQRTILLGDELLSSSDHGLFVCNTKTLQCHVETCRNATASRTRSIAVIGNKAIITGDRWYWYEKGKPLHPLKVDSKLNIINFLLQPLTNKDTAYAIENFNDYFFASKITLQADSVVVSNRIMHTNRVNTITQDGGQIFINTNTQTELSDGSIVAKNVTLTDRVTDRQGNKWYSSLQKGVLFEKNIGKWEKVDFPEIKEDDYIKCLSSTKNTLICGTNNGYIFSKEITKRKIKLNIKIPAKMGSVNNLLIYNNVLIVMPSIGLFLVDAETGKNREITNHGTIKNVTATDKNFFLAYSDSLASFPTTPPINHLFETDGQVDIDLVADDCNKMVQYEKCVRRKRCKYVCYDKETKVVYASFLDGLFGSQQQEFNALKLGEDAAYALTLAVSTNKIVMSTFKGLFYLNRDTAIPFTKINEQKSGVVTSLKAYKNYLFLIEKDELQVFDIRTQSLLNTIPLPDNYNGLVYNIEMIDNSLYLANPSGLYMLDFSSLQNNKDSSPVNYLLSVVADDKDITYEKNPNLKPSQNNLIFTFSAPGYIFPSHTFFKYQLLGSNDTTWHKMNEGEFSLSLASLKPGNYTLNAYAVDYRKESALTPLSFQFTINKPWWQTAWFIALSFIVIGSILYLSILYRFKRARKQIREKEIRQQQFDTQLLQSQIAVQEQERKRIAEDLHDDIGATLSALHLHISTLPEQVLNQSSEIQEFYNRSLLLTSKAANDVRDISHDLLPKDFSELGLFAVLQNRINELNVTNAIQLTFITDGNEKHLDNIYSITIYRIVNELITNIIKHSLAKEACLQILINNTEAQIIAEDDGVGINTEPAKRGIGMKNIQSRINFLKGELHIDSSDKGTVIIISIPIPKI